MVYNVYQNYIFKIRFQINLKKKEEDYFKE